MAGGGTHAVVASVDPGRVDLLLSSGISLPGAALRPQPPTCLASGLIPWKRAHDVEPDGDRVRGQPFLAKPAQLGFRRGRAGASHDERDGHLAQQIVRNADHRCLHDLLDPDVAGEGGSETERVARGVAFGHEECQHAVSTQGASAERGDHGAVDAPGERDDRATSARMSSRTSSRIAATMRTTASAGSIRIASRVNISRRLRRDRMVVGAETAASR
jgi:hypothetical protein